MNNRIQSRSNFSSLLQSVSLFCLHQTISRNVNIFNVERNEILKTSFLTVNTSSPWTSHNFFLVRSAFLPFNKKVKYAPFDLASLLSYTKNGIERIFLINTYSRSIRNNNTVQNEVGRINTSDTRVRKRNYFPDYDRIYLITSN